MEDQRRQTSRILAIMVALIVGMVFMLVTPDEVSAAVKKPSKVTLTSVKAVSDTSIKVTWKKTKNAKQYQVYRATSKNGKYKKIATTKSLSFTNKKLKRGKTYYYKVRGVNGKKTGKFSAVKSAVSLMTPPKVTISSVKAASDTSIKITWKKSKYAKQYQVYRATSKNGKYKKIATTKSLSYTNKKLTKGKTYYYKVRGVNGKKTGKFSAVKSVKACVHNYKNHYGTRSAWEWGTWWYAYSDYGINEKHVCLGCGFVTDNSIHGLDCNEKTTGEEAAMKAAQTQLMHRASYREMKEKYNDYKQCTKCKVKVYTTPAKVSISAAKAERYTHTYVYGYDFNKQYETVISWKPAKNAKKYEVYRSTLKNGKYTLDCITTETNIIVDNITSEKGKTFYYKVRGVNGNKKGAFSAAVSNKLKTPSQVAITGAKSVGGTSIEVSWKTAANAAHYQVYRATSKTGTYKLMGHTWSNYFIDTTAATGKTYYYKVRGITGKKNEIKGKFSTVKSAKPVPCVPTTAISLTAPWEAKFVFNYSHGADGYIVYRSVAGSSYKAYKTITQSEKRNLIDADLKPSTKYSYKARAYKTVNGKKIYSGYSKVRSVTTKTDKPTLSVKLNTDTSAVISWSKIDSKYNYIVYRNTAGGEFYEIKRVGGNSFTDTDLEPNTKYGYKVAVYDFSGDVILSYGTWSSVMYIQTPACTHEWKEHYSTKVVKEEYTYNEDGYTCSGCGFQTTDDNAANVHPYSDLHYDLDNRTFKDEVEMIPGTIKLTGYKDVEEGYVDYIYCTKCKTKK